MTDDAAFEETQYIRQVWWITLLLFGLTAFMWYGFIVQIFFGVPIGANPASDWGMWLLVMIGSQKPYELAEAIERLWKI